MRRLGKKSWVGVLAFMVLSGCGGEAAYDAKRPAIRERSQPNVAMNGLEVEAGYVAAQTLPPGEEVYETVVENKFLDAMSNPKSTFSIDVDTASYANVRRMISSGEKPPRAAVRIEELINYFDYGYTGPDSDRPFSVHTDIATCPWNEAHQLVRIGLKGKTFPRSRRPDCNLVFLLDVSGSMAAENKLPLVKEAMRMLSRNLRRSDRIGIVVYAGASGVVLPSTPASDQKAIERALEKLSAGGSTNGGEGLHLAYKMATQNFIDDGVNRVILCTDGDFNVGVTGKDSLVELIQRKAESGTELSVLGFGTGNIKDNVMESLADKGNGNYAYIDSELEAQKALIDQLDGTLITIAKDVKIQVDFNPARVKQYRLVGYENRMLENRDFLDDKKDAGEIGAGHSVTALYEIVPPGAVRQVSFEEESSEFVQTKLSDKALDSDVVLQVNLRYKQPDGFASEGFSVDLNHKADALPGLPTGEFRFAAGVAEYGLLLRDSKHKGNASWQSVIRAAKENLGDDRHGYREEFVLLARQASAL